MKLFHVSLGLQDKQKLFVPRVPESCAKEQGEDAVIPRICFSASVEAKTNVKYWRLQKL